MSARTIVYSALGPELEVFDLDMSSGELNTRQLLRLDNVIQYGWPNRARTVFYFVTSGAGPMAKVKVQDHAVHALRILPDGTLERLAPPVRLASRPLHVSLDNEEHHLLIAYNVPANVTVHCIDQDGKIGAQVEQQALEFGTTVHQARVTPHGNIAIVPACAHDTAGTAAGSVGIFSYLDGHLAPLARMEADPKRAAAWQGVWLGAQGFSARHVDFHPTSPWMYLCVETQGEIRLHDYDKTGVTLEPRFIKSTLEGVTSDRSTQLASAVHVHPNGKFIYVANRAWGTERSEGVDVFVGGVNDIAVFSIDQKTGEPTLIQHAETHGISPRTFGIDATGRMLVAGNQEPVMIKDGDAMRRIVPSLAMFRIGDDGRLTLSGQHDFADNGEVCFWMGVETIGAETAV